MYLSHADADIFDSLHKKKKVLNNHFIHNICLESCVSATAPSRINSHRAAEQMIHVVIPTPIESAISSNHQLEEAIVFFLCPYV